MSTYEKVPISNKFFRVAFPNKCVYCGMPAETKIVEKVTGASVYQRGWKNVTVDYSTELDIPYCKKHKEDSKRNKTILRLLLQSTLEDL